MGADGPRECPDRKDPEWQLEMGQGHPTAPQEMRGAGREKSSWLGLWGTICVRQMLSVGRVLWAVAGDGGCVVSEL